MLVDALRLDRGTLRSPRETPQGFLRVDGYATRVGVLEYADPTYPGGIRRELRLPEELFDPASLASYEAAPVTDDHPPEMVTAHNATAYARGTVMASARRDGDHVAVELTLTDAALIGKARRGKVELSSGYAIKLDPTPGVHASYGRYDAVQRHIRINHVAVVDVGRAGPTARIRMDALSSLGAGALASISQCGEHTAPAHGALSATRVEMPPMADTDTKMTHLAELAASEKMRADKAEGERNDATARAEKAEGQVEVLTKTVEQLQLERRDDAALAAKDAEIKLKSERIDALERELTANPAKIATAVKARVALERDAARVLGADARFDDLDDRSVMLLVLEKRGVAVDAERGDAHIHGAFEATVKNFVAGRDALRSINRDMPQPVPVPTAPAGDGRTDAAPAVPLTAKQAREQMVTRQRNAWRG